METSAWQPGPYEPGPQGNDAEGCGTIVLEGAALLGAVVFTVLAVLAWLVR